MHMIGSQFSIAIFQGIQFLLVARALGASQFGTVAGVLAITSALLPFSGLGVGSVAIMRLARKEAPASLCYGNGLLVSTISGVLLCLFAVLAGSAFLRDDSLRSLIAVFAVSEILITKFIDVSAQIHLGQERQAIAGACLASLGLSRALMAGAFFVLAPQGGGLTWAWFHLAAGAIALVFVSALTISKVGRPTFAPRLVFADMKIGVFFSIGLASKSIYTDIDKAVLARYATPEISGAYTAAFRVIYMAFTPISAMLVARQGQMFREGRSNGIAATLRFANRLLRYGLVYCLLFALMVFVFAPLIEWALGGGFALSTEIIKTLAFLPVALMLQSVYSDALMGADKQRSRSIAQVAVAIICIALNMHFIPKLSWTGAVMSTYLTQLILVGIVGTIIAVSMSRESRSRGREH